MKLGGSPDFTFDRARNKKRHVFQERKNQISKEKEKTFNRAKISDLDRGSITAAVPFMQPTRAQPFIRVVKR